ncbi:hypothetical protein CAAN1_02S02322 [[Candida] anglica]
MAQVGKISSQEGISSLEDDEDTFIFNRREAIEIKSAKESADYEFKKERTSKYWIHGIKLPHTVVKYVPEEEGTKMRVYGDNSDSAVFEPQIFVQPIDNDVFAGTTTATAGIKNHAVLDDLPSEILAKAEAPQGFSGYYSIPKATVNFPRSPKDPVLNARMRKKVPKLTYHNYFNLNGFVYSFGGLYTTNFLDLKYLGIPNDVNLDMISVHLPCDLPPYLDRNILMNPFMRTNPHLIETSNARGTIKYLDENASTPYPKHISGMTACQLSKAQIFFYGGFEIKVTSTKYNPNIDRWIIEKQVLLNSNGYIFDTFTSSFSKVELNWKNGQSVPGRIGNAIEASIYEQSFESITPEVPQSYKESHVPSPPVFGNNSSSSSSVMSDVSTYPRMQSPLPSSPLQHESTPPKQTNTRLRVQEIETNTSTSSGSSSRLEVTNVTTINQVTQQQQQQQQQQSSSPTTPVPVETGGATTQGPKTSSQSAAVKQTTVEQLKSPTVSRLNSSASTGNSKVANVLGKSAKLFHRSHQKSTSSSASSATSSNHLKNTYSKQVKQHRSNSNHSSRPVSPVLKVASPTPVHPKQNMSRLNTDQTWQAGTSSSSASGSVNKKGIPAYLSPTGATDLSFEVKSPPGTPAVQGGSNTPDQKLAAFSPLWTHERRSKEATTENAVNTTGFVSVCVFIFGGFKSKDGDSPYVTAFEATDEFLKIDLLIQSSSYNYLDFGDSANVFKVGTGADIRKELWPTPRGYFASALIDVNSSMEDNCQIKLYAASSTSDAIEDSGDELNNSIPSSSRQSTSSTRKNVRTLENYFSGKALLVQGGCNEDYETFSDFYLFIFDTGKWQSMSTYAYDYFDSPLKPWEDENILNLTPEKIEQDADLVEAELRSCHHQTLYFKNEERDYLFFIGGFNNDYLRQYDPVPYESDKFDVSRLSRFQFAGQNNFISRIMILNLQTQTWRFLRYFYDVRHVINDSFLTQLKENPGWINARICNVGGSMSLNGKTLTIGHGLMVPVPEKTEDFEAFKERYGSALLWGGHFTWTFPSL